MKYTQPKWTKEQLEEIYASYNECAYLAEGHGWQKKKTDTKKSKENKKA